MLHIARFALVAGLAAGIASVSFAIDPPPRDDRKTAPKQDQKGKAAKPAPPRDNSADERIDRRQSRMRERDKEIDRRLNKQKK